VPPWPTRRSANTRRWSVPVRDALLFDNNISHHIVARIRDIFPRATHVMNERLDAASDKAVWRFAKTHGYTIVTKDEDFNDMVLHYGMPPKVIWLKVGNCRTAEIEAILRKNLSAIRAFLKDGERSILEIIGVP